MKEDKISEKAWNKIARVFQERYEIEVSSIVYSPFGPTEDEINLLEGKKGKSIIDIGAGGCQKAIYLAKQGSKVTAYDISREEIEYGKKLASKHNVLLDFVKGDFQSLSSHFPENHFDLAYSIFALQYCRNVSVLKKTFSEVYKILKQGGTFVFSFDHPFRSVGFWDIENDRFVIDNYFNRNEKEWDYAFPEAGASGRFRGTFFTLSDIINSVIYAGFRLELLMEPEPIEREKYFDKFGISSSYGQDSKKDPFNFSNLKRIPGTLIIKAMKEG